MGTGQHWEKTSCVPVSIPKSFPIQRDAHFLTVCRYVERNALSAGVVARAEDWRWGSLWARRQGSEALQGLLSAWPVDRPKHWVRAVNRPLSAKEQERLRTSVQRNCPFGDETWQQRTAERLGLTASLRGEGRPRKTRRNGNGSTLGEN